MSSRRTETLRSAQNLTATMARHTEAARKSGLWPAVKCSLDERALNLPVELIDRYGGPESDEAMTAYSIAINACIYHRWSTRTRALYAPDTDFIADMTRATRDRDMDWSILNRLPVANPAVVFPRPYPFTSPVSGRTCHIRGFFTFGRDESLLLTDTTDPDADRIGIVALLDADPGGEQATLWAQGTFPTFGNVPYAERFASELARFQPNPDGLDRSDQEAVVLESMAVVFASLLYLCCEDRDEQRLTSLPLAAPSSRRAARPRMASISSLGWNISDALTRAKQRRLEADPVRRTPAEGGGWTQPPHTRSMHLKRVHYGPRRSETRWQLILPYQVGLDLSDAPIRILT